MSDTYKILEGSALNKNRWKTVYMFKVSVLNYVCAYITSKIAIIQLHFQIELDNKF